MATNFVTASYQEVYDLSNQAGEVSVLGIRTPNSGTPQKLLSGFFSQFRKFRYYGCEVRVQPASMLPADPLQIGLEAGETLDPRDLLNPILFHGCHGDDLNYALNMIYQNGNSLSAVPNSSVDEIDVPLEQAFVRDPVAGNRVNMEDIYYSCLSDRSWKKFGVQQPFRLRLRPLVHEVVMSKVFQPTDAAPTLGSLIPNADGTGYELGMSAFRNVEVPHDGETARPENRPQIFTNRLTSMGWLDCRRSLVSSTGVTSSKSVGAIPKTFMGILLLPPSYRQEMYMRILIVHKFGFKDFTSSLNWDVANQVFENLPESATAASTSIVDPEASALSLESPSANIVQTTTGVF